MRSLNGLRRAPGSVLVVAGIPRRVATMGAPPRESGARLELELELELGGFRRDAFGGDRVEMALRFGTRRSETRASVVPARVGAERMGAIRVLQPGDARARVRRGGGPGRAPRRRRARRRVQKETARVFRRARRAGGVVLPGTTENARVRVRAARSSQNPHSERRFSQTEPPGRRRERRRGPRGETARSLPRRPARSTPPRWRFFRKRATAAPAVGSRARKGRTARATAAAAARAPSAGRRFRKRVGASAGGGRVRALGPKVRRRHYARGFAVRGDDARRREKRARCRAEVRRRDDRPGFGRDDRAVPEQARRGASARGRGVREGRGGGREGGGEGVEAEAEAEAEAEGAGEEVDGRLLRFYATRRRVTPCQPATFRFRET